MSAGGYYGDRYCPVHGYYWGAGCPSCSSAVPQPQPQTAVRWDRTQEILDALDRIALAVERLASNQESSRE